MKCTEKYKLKDIVDRRMGYPFRKTPERAVADACALVQMKDLAGKDIVGGNFELVERPDHWERHQLAYSDLLLAVRGEKNNAAVFGGSQFPAVAASHLMVLHPKADA